ncbi:HET-domain-containing protein, partial [Lophiostoma macrostomum CBS 122681]
MRLHSDQGTAGSPLICELYPADILHPTFEGLGVRYPSDEEDCLIHYDALSYTWGDGVRKDTIMCNGVEFSISQNLSEALRALRPSQDQVRYLWADAICINQSDEKEKSEQVWNMLMIYQKATSVVAWLGPAQEDMENVLVAASTISSEVSHETVFDVWGLRRGLSYIYTRPWFQRLWVQQEIFAAR